MSTILESRLRPHDYIPVQCPHCKTSIEYILFVPFFLSSSSLLRPPYPSSSPSFLLHLQSLPYASIVPSPMLLPFVQTDIQPSSSSLRFHFVVFRFSKGKGSCFQGDVEEDWNSRESYRDGVL